MPREALTETPEAPKLTLVEWYDLPEEVSGEWVDGRLEEEEVPDFVHEFIVSLLNHLFAGWILPRGGVLGGSDAKLAVSETRGRKPDLTVYLPDEAFPPRRGLVRVPPYVAVEVISPKPRDTRRDRVDKLAEYADFGVRYSWLVDPELRTVEILELGADGRYVHAQGASSGVIDPVPGCEGLVLNLDELWDMVDRLEPEA
jgi:Uma2 family endonuclease